MPLLVALTRLVWRLAEATRFTSRIHEIHWELQLPARSLTLFLRFEDESSHLCAKAKQQYKERQLHSSSSNLPWTGISFELHGKYIGFTPEIQKI